MLLKRKLHNAEGSITAGMVFFLIGLLTSTFANRSMVGVWLNSLIQAPSLVDTIQGFAHGFSLPMFFAALFFMLRGVKMRRSV